MRFETVVAAGLLWLSSSCVEQEAIAPNASNTLVVHAILDASSRDQAVAVQIARGTIQHIEVVTGAIVLLTLPDGRRLQAITDTVPSSLFRYHFPLDALGFELVPGGTYQLEIQVPDGRTVTGHTTIPRATPVSLVAPEERLRPETDTLHMRWPRVAYAGAYEVSITIVEQQVGVPNAVFADTAVDLTTASRGITGNLLLWPGFLNRIAVSAVDSNYYDYYRRQSDFFTGVGLITHLEGAEGLFGSIVPIGARLLNVR